MSTQLSHFLASLKSSLSRSAERVAVLLHEDSQLDLAHWITASDIQSRLIISEELDMGVPASKATTVLGDEYELIVYDVRRQFNLDVLGRISGALVASGILLILLPDRKSWQAQDGRYRAIFDRHLHDASVYTIDEGQLPTISTGPEYTAEAGPDPFRTREQQQAVERISQLITQQGASCVVLSAGRGRGKSSALGFIAANALGGDRNVLVTAPRLSVADPLFKHLGSQLTGDQPGSEYHYENAWLRFIAPDMLLQTQPVCDVLMIDEAAAIPLSILSQLLARYPKIIFSTTTHGYEGTGRGFILKFQRMLDSVRPEWKNIQLHEPVRWIRHDPLEQWIEKLLFLNIQLPAEVSLSQDSERYELQQVDRDRLVDDTEFRNSVFALLVYAHYRTSPADFQYLLDSADVRLYTLSLQGQVLAVCLVNQEGGFTSELSEAIYRGERRPRGHLLAQTLCFHAGARAAATLVYSRIMRIAVHPLLQSNGLGSQLIRSVIQSEQQRGIDIVGSSFSASPELMRFWYRVDMGIFRMGFSRDHVTASYSAVVARALSQRAEALLGTLEQKFWRNLPHWLEGPLRELSADMRECLEHDQPEYDDALNQDDREDIESYACFNRNFEACYPALRRLLIQHNDELQEQAQRVIKVCLSHAPNWKQIASTLNTSGRAESEKKLKESLVKVLQNGFNA